MLKRFWISWSQPTEDDRPLTYPPNAAILGWWCSGYDADGYATLCAFVQAKSEADAELQVLKDWPEAGPWRFNDERAWDWEPSDRFPLSDWMEERMKSPPLAQEAG